MRMTTTLTGLMLTTFWLTAGSAAAEDVELVGSWGSKVSTTATITAPIVGASASSVDLALKFDVRREAGQLTTEVQICSLSTKSPALTIDYTKLVPYLKATVQHADEVVPVGGDVVVPKMLFRVGTDEAGKPVDTDGDKQPGATLLARVAGLLDINTYVGFNVSIHIDAIAQDANTIAGTTTFEGTGKILGSNFPLLTSGDITVVQTTNPQAFSAKRLGPGVTCANLAAQL